MTQFNDTVKNVAIENIVSFLKNPEGKSSVDQVSLIIETVQNAFVTNDDEKDAQATLVRFLETYINKLAARADGEIPDFLNGIIAADTTPTVTSVAQILARLRCNAVKEEHSDFIINHLTYFIEYLKDKYGACTHVCKKFGIAYSDYSNVISEVTKWALEAYNPPILIQFNSKDEWEDFRTRTSDEGHYACQFNGVALALTRKTSEIDKFDSSKYPMEVRIKGTKEFPDHMRNIPQEEIDAFWFSIRGYKETRLQKFINRQIEAFENFVMRNKKVLIGTGLSITAIASILLFTILYDTQKEKLEARKEICKRFTADALPNVGNLFYGSGLMLEGDYSVRELYKLAEILKDKKVEDGELSRSLYRKWKKGTDCITLYDLGFDVKIGLIGHESEALKEFHRRKEEERRRKEEERLNNTYPDSWMVGKWKGSAYTTDFFGNPTHLVMILKIDKYGNAIQFAKSSTGPGDIEQVELKYDRREHKLYFYDGPVRVCYDVNEQNKTIRSGDMVFHKTIL